MHTFTKKPLTNISWCTGNGCLQLQNWRRSLTSGCNPQECQSCPMPGLWLLRKFYLVIISWWETVNPLESADGGLGYAFLRVCLNLSINLSMLCSWFWQARGLPILGAMCSIRLCQHRSTTHVRSLSVLVSRCMDMRLTTFCDFGCCVHCSHLLTSWAWIYCCVFGKGILRSRVFLLGPSHHHYTRKCALSTVSIYKTPIGDLPIDLEGIFSEFCQPNWCNFLCPYCDKYRSIRGSSCFFSN